MEKELRKTGIDFIGNASWGTHLCQFYQTPEDLIDILVPYFKAGLENNEFCMWITAEPLNTKKAKASLKKVVRNLDNYIEKDQIEILDFSQWYTKSGKFDADEILDGWIEKEKQAQERGFDGLRLTGNTFWLEDKDWRGFTEYEEMINDVIGNYKMLAICSYSLGKCGATEIMDVVANHQFALAKRENRWEIIESSERKQAEEALWESEERYRGLYESSKDGIASADSDGNFLECNQAFEEMIGYTKEEINNLGFRDITPSKWHDLDTKFFTEQMIPRGYSDEYEKEYIKKNGTTLPVSLRGWFIEDKEGNRTGTWAVVRDITERKLAEEALRESEEKYRTILENTEEGYYEVDIAGNFTFFNDAMCRIQGLSRDELMGMSNREYMTEETAKEVYQAFNEVYTTGKPAKNLEWETIRKDGTKRHVETSISLIKDSDGNPIGFRGLVRDVTDRKLAEEEKERLEDQLRQAQKMESIGTMAGGIAHDFNNILGIIIGNTELAIDDVPEWNPAKGCLEEIRTASLRAKDVVRHILSFARRTVTERKPVETTSIIKDSLKLLRASIPATVEIRQDFSCKHDTILADPTQINQVLMNLCTNASHAMREEGGVLEVSLRNVELEMGNEELDLEPGRYVKLSVSDTGPGIDSGFIDRIFDPYFTTKGLGEGTGMGLAVVQGIVKNHDGAVMVKSEPGKGAVFEVFFPLTEAEAEPEDKEADALPTGNEKILFVDDEESLVKMGRRMLERLGYRVETKTNPIEALDLVRSEPDRFDLVITDMTMPQMTGDKLVKEILSIRPDMPIILCTGFSEKIDDERAKELGISKYIEKPFAIPDFPTAVRNVLDAENEK